MHVALPPSLVYKDLYKKSKQKVRLDVSMHSMIKFDDNIRTLLNGG